MASSVWHFVHWNTSMTQEHTAKFLTSTPSILMAAFVLKDVQVCFYCFHHLLTFKNVSLHNKYNLD